MSEDKPFSLRGRFRKVSGANYLDVANRLLWLKNDIDGGRYPPDTDYEIQTSLHTLDLNEQIAVFKATVTIMTQTGNGRQEVRSASGYGSETAADFKDFIEKAETKALGRALSHLGYGTEAGLEEEGMIVDAPRPSRVNPAPSMDRVPMTRNTGSSAHTPRDDVPMTDRQRNYLLAVAREAGMSEGDLHDYIDSEYAKGLEQLSRKEASDSIDAIQSGRATGNSRDGADDNTTNEEANTAEEGISSGQVKQVLLIAKKKHIEQDDLHRRIGEVYGKALDMLTKDEADELIVQLTNAKERVPA